MASSDGDLAAGRGRCPSALDSYFAALLFGAFRAHMSSRWINPFDHHVKSLSLVIFFALNSVLSDIDTIHLQVDPGGSRILITLGGGWENWPPTGLHGDGDGAALLVLGDSGHLDFPLCLL